MTSKCKSCGVYCSFYSEIIVETDDPNLDTLREAGLVEQKQYEHTGRVFYQMRTADGGRCMALGGTVGEYVRCLIYENRPHVCREYQEDSASCRTAVFINITRKGKPLFVQGDPSSWPSYDPQTA